MDKVIGNNIRRLREKLGLTQHMLANYLDITREEMSYYETGKRNIPSRLVSKAAELFSVDEYDLYEEDGGIVQTNIAFAFRADGICIEDLKEIASFKKIAMNYLKMQTVLANNE